MTTGSTTVLDTRGIPVYSFSFTSRAGLAVAVTEDAIGTGTDSASVTVIVFDGGGRTTDGVGGFNLSILAVVTFGIVDRSVCNVTCGTLNVTDVFLWIAPVKSLHETIFIHYYLAL
jgi:hypothetical protein